MVGVTVSETSVAGVTASVVDPDIEPDVAVIVVEPAETEETRPFKPFVLLIVAMPVLLDIQLTDEVMF